MPEKPFKGIKDGALSAERLKMTPAYERFDQCHNMIYAGEWDERYAGLGSKNWCDSRDEKIAKKLAGFRREDWALFRAATASARNMGLEINRSDSDGTRWDSIGNLYDEKLVDTLVPKWEASPEENTGLIKQEALSFGAGDVGICKLDRRFVYGSYYDVKTNASYPIRFSDEPGYEDITLPATMPDGTKVIPATVRYAIVMVLPMDLPGVKTAMRLTHTATTDRAYSKIGDLINTLAEFIRGLGYIAIPSANDTAMNIPLAVDAGLGEVAKAAKLCHPRFGTCCRICKVFTDLPLVADTPITFGVHDFCMSCQRCAKRCPAHAIPLDEDVTDTPKGDFSPQHITQWNLDHAKCRELWVRNGTNCGLCIAVCPLNQPNTAEHLKNKELMATHPELNRETLRAMLSSDPCDVITPDKFWQPYKK